MAITYGSKYVYNSAGTSYNDITWLDATTFVVVFKDAGNSDKGTAVVGTLSGTTISYGSEYTFTTGVANYISVTAISSTKFFVAFSNASSSSNGESYIGTISGTTISYSALVTFNSGSASYISTTKLDDDRVVVSYLNGANNGYGTSLVGDISGANTVYGSKYVFNSALSYYNSSCTMSSSYIAVAYRDEGNSSNGRAIIGYITGTTILFGTAATFNAASTDYPSIVAMDSTHYTVAYRDGGNGNRGTATVGTRVGSTTSHGSEYVFNTGVTNNIDATAMDSENFIVGYTDGSSSNRGYSVHGELSGSTISFGSETYFTTYSSTFISVESTSPSTFVVVFNDSGSNGTGIVGKIPYVEVITDNAMLLSFNF